MGIEFFVRLYSVVMGVSIFVHFICKANFLDPKLAPKPIILLNSVLVASSVSLICYSLTGDLNNILMSFLFLVSAWFLQDFLLWAYGYPLADFFDEKRKQ